MRIEQTEAGTILKNLPAESFLALNLLLQSPTSNLHKNCLEFFLFLFFFFRFTQSLNIPRYNVRCKWQRIYKFLFIYKMRGTSSFLLRYKSTRDFYSSIITRERSFSVLIICYWMLSLKKIFGPLVILISS